MSFTILAKTAVFSEIFFFFKNKNKKFPVKSQPHIVGSQSRVMRQAHTVAITLVLLFIANLKVKICVQNVCSLYLFLLACLKAI